MLLLSQPLNPNKRREVVSWEKSKYSKISKSRFHGFFLVLLGITLLSRLFFNVKSIKNEYTR